MSHIESSVARRVIASSVVLVAVGSLCATTLARSPKPPQRPSLDSLLELDDLVPGEGERRIEGELPGRIGPTRGVAVVSVTSEQAVAAVEAETAEIEANPACADHADHPDCVRPLLCVPLFLVRAEYTAPSAHDDGAAGWTPLGEAVALEVDPDWCSPDVVGLERSELDGDEAAEITVDLRTTDPGYAGGETTWRLVVDEDSGVVQLATEWASASDFEPMDWQSRRRVVEHRDLDDDGDLDLVLETARYKLSCALDDEGWPRQPTEPVDLDDDETGCEVNTSTETLHFDADRGVWSP